MFKAKRWNGVVCNVYAVSRTENDKTDFLVYDGRYFVWDESEFYEPVEEEDHED